MWLQVLHEPSTARVACLKIFVDFHTCICELVSWGFLLQACQSIQRKPSTLTQKCHWGWTLVNWKTYAARSQLVSFHCCKIECLFIWISTQWKEGIVLTSIYTWTWGQGGSQFIRSRISSKHFNRQILFTRSKALSDTYFYACMTFWGTWWGSGQVCVERRPHSVFSGKFSMSLCR